MTTDTTLRSSAEWQAKFPDWVVRDPDGWDRSNFTESWNEPITYTEYYQRLAMSTVQYVGEPGKSAT